LKADIFIHLVVGVVDNWDVFDSLGSSGTNELDSRDLLAVALEPETEVVLADGVAEGAADGTDVGVLVPCSTVVGMLVTRGTNPRGGSVATSADVVASGEAVAAAGVLSLLGAGAISMKLRTSPKLEALLHKGPKATAFVVTAIASLICSVSLSSMVTCVLLSSMEVTPDMSL
jgi:hypothetical protein